MCQPANRAVYVPRKRLTAQGQNNLPGQQAPIRFQMSQEFFFRHKPSNTKATPVLVCPCVALLIVFRQFTV